MNDESIYLRMYGIFIRKQLNKRKAQVELGYIFNISYRFISIHCLILNLWTKNRILLCYECHRRPIYIFK